MTTEKTGPTPDDQQADDADHFDIEPDTGEPVDMSASDLDPAWMPETAEPRPSVAPAAPTRPVPPAGAAKQGVFRRLLTTPMRDLARGRFSGRLDVRQFLRDAGLPDVLRVIVLAVVNRSRLWPIEKADVGRELTAHFRDGLDRGETPEALAAAFGPPNRAARLIRRAKRRGRSTAWRLWLRTAQVAGLVLALLVGIYLVATVRLFTGRPVISRDYLIEANAAASEVPADSRAWGLYRQALVALGELPDGFMRGDVYPGTEHWDAVARYLDQHAEAMELVREAAARPGLGYVVGYGIDEADRVLWPDMPVAGDADHDAGLQGGMAAVLLPYLAQMRRLGWLLSLDAVRAAELGDGALATANVEAIMGVARQTIEVPFILNNLVAFRQASLAVTTLGEILSDRPDVFTDEQLGRLAHRLSALFGGRLQPRLDGERMMFDDFVQRLYTDDGNGGGRLTARGLSSLGYLAGAGPLAPVAGLMIANRRDMTEEFGRWFALIEAEFAKPLWRRDLTRINREINDQAQSPVYMSRYLFIPLLMQTLARVGTKPELVTQERDAVSVAIALELYRRRHGSWPSSLDELIPDLLPEIPPDRFDGRPLRYRVIDDNPVIYSVGADRDDDGALLPRGFARFAPENATLVNDDGTARADGDWVLWPVIRPQWAERPRGEISRRAGRAGEG